MRQAGTVCFALALGLLTYDAYFQPPTLPPDALIESESLALGLAVLNVVCVSITVFAIIGYALENLRREQASVEDLPLNILPPAIAERIKTARASSPTASRRSRCCSPTWSASPGFPRRFPPTTRSGC